MANSVDDLRMSSPGGPSIEPSVSSSYGIDMIALTGMSRKGSEIEIILTTEREIGPGRAGRVSRGLWCNLGLKLVIPGAVELRREAMRTVE
jgi:hypothetical protein